MTAIELRNEINKVYLEMKSRGFLEIDDLIQRRDELTLQKFQMIADSGISGHEALLRMLEIKKQMPMSDEYKERYELLSMIRQAQVKYFYDNNLVA